METLPVNSLDFNLVKQNFINFLKADSRYNDFNFEASGISSLLNILAYNTHYIGYYVKMMLNESFVDSAVTRESLMSMAKLNGYVPKGRKASQVEIQLDIKANTYQPSNIVVNKGSFFNSANTSNDSRTFQVIDDYVAYYKETDTNGKFVYRANLTAYEGTYEHLKFFVDSSVINQRFILDDSNVDVDTIRVKVYPDGVPSNTTEYKLGKSIDVIKSDSPVFYISTNEQGFYEIFFGGGVFGKQPENTNVVEVSFVSTNGDSGNNAKVFSFVPDGDMGSFDSYITTPLSASYGGTEKEDLETLRFAIPNHYRSQNRTVTESDFHTLLLSTYRDIDSINVWGGERNYQKDYGAVYVCIKPKSGLKLSASAKNEISNLLRKTSTVGAKIKIIDPEYTNVNLTVFVKYDNSKTSLSSGSIQNQIRNKVIEYNDTYLNRFNVGLSDVAMLDFVKNDISSIVRIYDLKKVNKTQTIFVDGSENVFLFGNQIQEGSIVGTDGMTDKAGVLYVENNQVGTVDYTNGIVKFTKTSGDTEYKIVCELVSPDVETYLNNIVRIDQIEVIVNG